MSCKGFGICCFKNKESEKLMEGGCPVSMKSKRNLSIRELRLKRISPDVASPMCRCSKKSFVPRELVLMLSPKCRCSKRASFQGNKFCCYERNYTLFGRHDTRKAWPTQISMILCTFTVSENFR